MFAVPLRREEAAVDCQEGKKEDGLLQKVQLVDLEGLGGHV